MEDKVTGLVISSIDYKDKDKLVTLITMKYGKIVAQLKGVKSDKAKLKYAGQLFCFGEYMLARSGEHYIITSCNCIDSFYDLVNDYDKFSCASILLESASKVYKDNIVNDRLLLGIVQTLSELCYSDSNAKSVLCKYMIGLYKESGYELNLDKCFECGHILDGNVYLHTFTGNFVCESGKDVMNVPSQVFKYFKEINDIKMANIKSVEVDENVLNKSIILLNTIFRIHFGAKLNSIDKYLE